MMLSMVYQCHRLHPAILLIHPERTARPTTIVRAAVILLLILLPSISCMDSIISIPLAVMNGQRVPAPKASTVLPVLERMAAQQGSRGQGWQEASVAVEEEGLGIQEFWAKYQEPNRPVIVKGATKGWRASKEWVVTDESGRRMPNFSLLKQLFGDDEVCAARCAEKHFSDQKREEMRMRDFLDCWQAGRRRDELLYVKDWHFARLHRDYNAYECPEIFSEDWLNRWYDARDDADDYRFCYMGREGTWTPLHRDVLRSYSWSANVMGRKLWIMYPPKEEHKLRDSLGNLVWDVEGCVDSAAFPDFGGAECVRVVQEEGDAIFVPSGWWHQVKNMDDCISINHNWVNSCSIASATAQVLDDHQDVVKSIQESCGDADDFPSVCETLLQAHAGINLKGFSGFLAHCAFEEESIAGSVRGGDRDAAVSCAFRLAVVKSSIRKIMELPHAKWLAGRGLLQGGSEAEQAVARGLRCQLSNWAKEGESPCTGGGEGNDARLVLESLAAPLASDLDV